jgi:hypothetical protein
MVDTMGLRNQVTKSYAWFCIFGWIDFQDIIGLRSRPAFCGMAGKPSFDTELRTKCEGLPACFGCPAKRRDWKD